MAKSLYSRSCGKVVKFPLAAKKKKRNISLILRKKRKDLLGLNLKESSFRSDFRRKIFTVRQKLWMFCPWKCSSPDWVGFEQSGLVEGVLPVAGVLEPDDP